MSEGEKEIESGREGREIRRGIFDLRETIRGISREMCLRGTGNIDAAPCVDKFDSLLLLGGSINQLICAALFMQMQHKVLHRAKNSQQNKTIQAVKRSRNTHR